MTESHRLPATTTHPADVPSAAWGWSGEAPRASRIAAWIVTGILLLMIIGNHDGHVEDLWLIGIAGTMVLVLVRDILKRRKPRHS